MKLFLTHLISLSLLVAIPAAAEVYKWTDAYGQVHYGDQPPTLTHSEQTTVRDSYKSAASVQTEAAAEAPAIERRIVALPPKDPEKCKLAQASQKLLNSGVRLRTTSPSGEVGFLGKNEIADQLDIAKQTIAIHCD